uniref:Single strand binding protein n=1 Tax=Siphoviridae sp. ctvok7 TaxID=2827596 RepID=A0A8S5LLU3_9CAUD|nr:MAG TPA: Single strand binding protein [Siphoviridae sp. ctvok7]
MLNHVSIMGRLTRDPELRTTQSGLSTTTFSLAVDRDFKDKASGKRGVDFIDVVAWRQTAEFVCRYFTKGRMAVVDGRLQARTWEDKQGNKRKSVEVVAASIYFGDSKRDGGGAPSAPVENDGYMPPPVGNRSVPNEGFGQDAFEGFSSEADLPF